MDLLKRILPHCTLEHLTNIEKNTKMDLSSVTDPLWKRFYYQEFGQEHTNKVIARLKALKETRPDAKYTWWELFAARKKKQKQAEDEMVEKFTKKFQAEKAFISRTNLAYILAGSGPSSLSNCSYKSPMLKKARMEADNRARLQSAIQRNTFARSSQPIRTTSFNGQRHQTITKPIHRPNSIITVTKPIHRPNSTITVWVRAGFTDPIQPSTNRWVWAGKFRTAGPNSRKWFAAPSQGPLQEAHVCDITRSSAGSSCVLCRKHLLCTSCATFHPPAVQLELYLKRSSTP
ncbi:unnamed protein product [Miscanthus lutarioriparius]|uniref:Elongin-A n=1 Tax=Miscanthus lutarioriparius TaxID=422564 RepID=A0A811PLG6_9POAL|nr:unnamed protein product [Miscanthus lutarioriparius]